MKKFLTVVLVLAIIAAAAFCAVRLINDCDSCGEKFFGTGYEANIISDTLKNNDETICEECAKTQHAIEIGLGTKTLEDFEKPLFD